jgi:glucose-1-phosphate thymidylyltransferase
MRGVILAGGMGTRLNPATATINKHLIPIYDKPMIYYPLTTLMLAGIRSITIVSTPDGIQIIEKLFGDGLKWGIEIDYATQEKPAGIADGIRIALGNFAEPKNFLVILGDNIFYGQGLGETITQNLDNSRCTIWTQEVNNPSDFGIASLDDEGDIISIEEKPQSSKSNLAITGLYHFPYDVVDLITTTRKSARGEFEVTDLLNLYLDQSRLQLEKYSRGIYWLDAGTFENLNEASQFVRSVQVRQGMLIGSPEEVAWRMGFISSSELVRIVSGLPNSDYKQHLTKITAEFG